MIGKLMLFAGTALQAVSAAAAGSAIDQRIAAHLADTSTVVATSAAGVDARCAASLGLIGDKRAAIESSKGAATMTRDYRAFDRLGALLADGGFEMGLAAETSTSADVRKAAEACQAKISEVSTGVSLSRPIYDRLSAISLAGLDTNSRYLVEKSLKSFRLSGVDRDLAVRTKVAALQKKATEIGLKFDGNIREDKGDLALRPEELSGMPKDWLDARKPKADGLIHLSRDYTDVNPVFDFASNRDTRRKVSIFVRNRAYPVNEPVLKDLLTTRHELAQVLGYPNYAALITADKMIGTADRAGSFIDELALASNAAARADHAELLAFAKAKDPAIDQLQGWDFSYFSNQLRKAKYDVANEEVRQYFTYEKSRRGIFQMMGQMFGADIRPWTTKVWAPDVSAWELYDKGRLVGRFYLDMHPREGKFNHAAAFAIRIGVKGEQVPIASLVTNFPAKGPMDHDDVATFLHEFGHLIHFLYSGGTDYAGQSMANLQWDFIEAPSQLLEEWVWDYDTLKTFASNEAGQPIPATLVAKMNAGRRFGEAVGWRGQLASSALSLNFHNRAPDFDLKQLADAQTQRYSLFPVVPEAHSYASFGHLNSYSAIYYTYAWSKAIALDLFSNFKTAGIRNPVMASRYRRQVLEQGGSKDANDLIQDFLGRPTSLEAFKTELQGGAAQTGN